MKNVLLLLPLILFTTNLFAQNIKDTKKAVEASQSTLQTVNQITTAPTNCPETASMKSCRLVGTSLKIGDTEYNDYSKILGRVKTDELIADNNNLNQSHACKTEKSVCHVKGHTLYVGGKRYKSYPNENTFMDLLLDIRKLSENGLCTITPAPCSNSTTEIFVDGEIFRNYGERDYNIAINYHDLINDHICQKETPYTYKKP